MLFLTPKPVHFAHALKSTIRALAVVAGATALLFLLCLAHVPVHSPHAYAATSDNLNFQARLQTSTGAIAADGYYNVQFKIYDASTGGTLLWTETYYDSNGVTAGNDNRTRVSNGYLSVNLGSQTSFPSTMPWDQQLYVTMNIGGVTQTATPTWDGEMSPRLKLTAVPYAFNAKTASSLTATNSGHTTTINVSGTASGDVNYQFDASATAGTYSVCTSANNCSVQGGSGNYIQNQNATDQSANFRISGSGQAASYLASSSVTIGTASTQGQMMLQAGNGFTTTLKSAASANRTITFPASNGSNGDCITTDGAGQLSFGSCTGGAGAGVNTVGTFSGSSQTNGASISSTTITFGPADTTNPGMVSTAAQTFSGTKTFQSGLIINTATTTQDRILVSAAAAGAARFDGTITNADLTAPQTYTLPNASGTFAVSASGNIALSASGNITFSGTLPIANGGTGNTSYTTYGPTYYDGTKLASTAAGTTGQCLLSGNGTAAPAWGTCTGDGAGTGAAGGDLSGNYPNPTVAKINGQAITYTSLAANQVLVYNGTNWVNGTTAGDLTNSVSGNTNTYTIANSAVTSIKIADGTVTGSDIAGSTITNTNLQSGTFASVTGTGALTAGSIAAGFGAISTNSTIASSTTITGSQLVSTVVTGTAPLQVASTTLVTNLNADQLDGQHGSYYQNATNINAGTLGDSYLSSNVALYNRVTSNFTGTLQHNGNAVCDASGNCTGVAGGAIGGSGTLNKIPVFTGSGYTIGDSMLSQNAGATQLTLSGNLAATGNANVSGTITANAASITTDINASGTTYTGGLSVTGNAGVAGTLNVTGASGIDLGSSSVLGKLKFQDGSTAYTSTLNTSGALTNYRSVIVPDASGTLAVSASGNIALSAAGNISFTGQLPIANGGTGAASASGARSNLGAAASGANSDITSLSGLSTALSVSQGGTGLSSLTANQLLYASTSSAVSQLANGTSGQCLVSNGTGSAPSFQTCTGAGGVSSVNSQTGAITLNGTANRVIVSNVGSTFTLSTPQDISTTSNVTFNNVNATALLQTNGATRIDASGNLSNIGTITASGLITGSGGLTITGTTTINTTGTAATSIGNTTGALTLQGGGSVSLASSNGTNSTTLGFSGTQAAGNINYNLDRTVTAGTYTICTSAVSSCGGTTGPYVALQSGFPGTQQTGTINVQNVKANYFETTGTLQDVAGASAFYNGVTAASSTNNQYASSFSLNVAPGAASTRTYKVMNGYLSSSSSNLSGASLQAIQGYTQYNGTGTVGYAEGGDFQVDNTSSGTLTAAEALSVSMSNHGTGTISSATGINIDSAVNSGGGTITTNYGMYVGNQTAGTTDYGVYIQGADTAALYVNSGLAYLGGGLTAQGNTVNLNASSNYATNINTGTSTGTVSIGNSAAGAISIQSGSGIGLTGPTTVTGNFTVQGGNIDNLSNASKVTINAVAASSTNSQNAQTINLDVSPGFSPYYLNYNGLNTVVTSNSGYVYNADINSIQGKTIFNGGSGLTLGNATGGYFVAQNSNAGTINNAFGVGGQITNSNTGTINIGDALWAQIVNTSTGTIGQAHGLRVLSPTNAGTITQNFGIYVESQTAGTSNYGVYIQGADTAALYVASGLTALNGGLDAEGGTINLNNNTGSTYATNINTGTSTGTVNIGNSSAGSIGLQSSSDVTTTALHTVVRATTDTSNVFVVQNSLGWPVLSVNTSSGLINAGGRVYSGDFETPQDGSYYGNAYWDGSNTRYFNSGPTFEITNNSTMAYYLRYGITGTAGNIVSTNDVMSVQASNGQIAFTTGSQLLVNNTSSVTLFNVDTTANRVVIGPSGGDTNGTVLVLGNKTNAGDPSGVEGAMYYNSSMKQMRCYIDGMWDICGGAYRASQGYDLIEDFFTEDVSTGSTGSHSWDNSTSGTGAAVAKVASDSASRPGIIRLNTGSTATGRSALYMGDMTAANNFVIGGGEVVEMAINIPTLSDGTNTYTGRFGLCDSDSADCANGIYFEYSSAQSVNWRMATASSSSRTKTNSSTAVTTGWHRLKIVVNSAATSVSYYVDGNLLGSVTATIPTGTGNTTAPMFQMIKSVGTTSRTVSIDYYEIRKAASSLR